MESVIHQDNAAGDMDQSKAHRFQQFVEQTHPAALRLAAYLLGVHHHMAPDIVQKASLSAWRHLDKQDGTERLPAWFRRIVINEVRSYFRWHGVRHRFRGLVGLTYENESMPIQPDHGLRRRLAEALEGLSLRQREVFVLVYLNELTVTEAATIVGCAEGTAKSHLHRAVHQLRTELSDVWSPS